MGFFQKSLSMWGLPTEVIAVQIFASTSAILELSLTTAVGIVYCLWGLLFAPYCHSTHFQTVGNRWRALLWETVHFPLQIGVALLLSALGVSSPRVD